jgi:hypothetical protein
MNNDELIGLLKEAYVFIAMKHKAFDPWRVSLDTWQEKVESITNWNAYEEIEKYNESLKLNDPHQ